jgi:NAD(P)H-hydrate epimerase
MGKIMISWNVLFNMIPFSEVKVLDINSEYLGITPEFLMEEAGKGVAGLVKELVEEGSNVGIVCGTGNNAGDAFVAARQLSDVMEVTILLTRPAERIRSELALKNFERVRELSKEAEEVDMAEFDLLVDGLYGTGMKGTVGEPYRSLISRINEFKGIVVSIDVPSGLEADVRVIPDYTITFHDMKEGMAEDSCGKIIVHDIGMPTEAEEFVGPGEFIYYPVPSEESYRGDNGKVLIVSGGFFPGATALAGLSAYRIGVDLVHVAAPVLAYAPVANHSLNFIIHRLDSPDLEMDDLPDLERLLERVDALLLGTGLCEGEEAQRVEMELLRRSDRSVVVNADGLRMIAEDFSPLKGRNSVLIAHHTEFENLSGMDLGSSEEEGIETVRRFAEEINSTVILKGKVDLISDGNRIRKNRTGNPSMSVGGTGDTLAGILVGLLAKGIEPFNAARIASFTNGHAGDLAYDEMGYGMVASDLVDKIPLALKLQLEKVL